MIIAAARSGARRHLVVSTALSALTALAACERSAPIAATDSLLARDLTLASAATPPVFATGLGDTAAAPGIGAGVTPPPPVVSPPTERPVHRTAQRRPERPSRSTQPVTTPSTPPQTTVNQTVTEQPTPPAPVPAAAPASSPSGDNSDGANGAGTARSRGTIGAGTGLVGLTNVQICSLANRPGDRLVASLSDEIVGSNGLRLPKGTPILVEMAQPGPSGDFTFLLKAVQVDGVLIPAEGSVQTVGTTTERRVSKGGDQGKVVTGAIAGAILGRVLGGGTKGTVIGAAGGAAAGTIAASRNSVTEKCLPAGATLHVTLSAPIVLTPGTP